MTAKAQHEQRMNALQIATGIRQNRAKLKRELAAKSKAEGLRDVAGLLQEPPPELHTMQIGKLIGAVNRVGKRGLKQYLRLDYAKYLRPESTINGLNPDDREDLAEHLQRMAGQIR